jgi:hypothetical protein
VVSCGIWLRRDQRLDGNYHQIQLLIARPLRLGLGQGGAGFSSQRMSFAAIIHQELAVMIQLVSHAGAQGFVVSHWRSSFH